MYIQLAIAIFACGLLLCTTETVLSYGKSSARLRRSKTPLTKPQVQSVIKKNAIVYPLTEQHENNTSIPKLKARSSSQRNLIAVKKSDIEAVARTLENGADVRKDKRGFLANLANLLNDAELISGHKNAESGLSSVTLMDKVTNNNAATISESKPVDVAKKDVGVPSSDEIRKALNDSGPDFAPIFAMFHGKIVPLGKLPDTAFKKSHMEDQPSSLPETPKEIAGDHRTMPEEKQATPEDEGKSSSNEKKKDSDTARISKLQQYLKNLDGHIPATGETKDVRGVAKDEVVFPEGETGSPKSDIASHVKGVLLDNGKIVSINSNHPDTSDDTSKQNSELSSPESQQKFYVSDDGSLTPLTKSKPEIGETITRDTAGTADGQKTVALSLDVLKDLLKKTDTKISLASLLNKTPETKSDTPPTEEEDPGTIEDFAAGGLKAHNAYRAKHHDDALVWSDDLAAKSQKLAEALADRKSLEIAKDLEKEGFGENVAKVWATFKNAGEAAAKMWYSQSEHYKFFDPHLDGDTGQFAQVIWKDTRELGMGVAKSIDDVNNKYVYVTALYRPPGNIEATLRDNVLPSGNNTVDVYTTFFKRAGVLDQNPISTVKRSKLQAKPKKLNIVDEQD